MNLIRSLLTSKKFVAMVCGLVGLTALKVFKVAVDPQTVAEVVGLVAAYIVGQGISDNGKGAAQVNAIASFTTTPLTTTEQDKGIEAVKSV